MQKLAKIFLFTKDEGQLLDEWILYHGNLVGFDNLFICDHGSSEETLQVYEKYKNKGIHLKGVGERNFQNKWKILSAWMREESHDTKLLIPLDTDEFIVKRKVGSQNINANLEEIIKYLEDLPLKRTRYKFGNLIAAPIKTTYDDPLQEMIYFVPKEEGKGHKKSFYPGKFFIHTDQGNHTGKIIGEQNNTISSLSLLHFEIRGEDQLREKLIRGAQGYKFHKHKKPICGRHWHVRWKKLHLANRLNKWYKEVMDKNNKCLSSMIENKSFAHTLTSLKNKELT
jgi:hypothetical protein